MPTTACPTYGWVPLMLPFGSIHPLCPDLPFVTQFISHLPPYFKKILHKRGLCIIFAARHNYVLIAISPCTRCMILGKVLNLAQPQFPHLQNRDASNSLELL